jgi:hypothetical protein
VFVHGISGIALDWWSDTPFSGTNDMYLDAYNAGYRTAFVTLNANGQRGPGNDMWVNGQTLAQQIQYIAQYYSVDKVDVITHSKGGVDTQTAIVYYGAAAHVNQVFTLSAPNTGSPVADIVCTPSGASFAQSLQSNSVSATCAMTPAYMAMYRALTDPIAINQGITYRQAGGTYVGPAGSLLWASGIFMELGGFTNDGFVPISSSLALSYEPQFFIRQYDHDSIRLGHNAFPWIQAYLTGGTTLTPVAATNQAAAAAVSKPQTASLLLPWDQSGQIVRGGAVSGSTSTTVPIEAGAAGVHFAILTSSPATTVSLTSPSGQPQTLSSQVTMKDGEFAGASYAGVDVASPEAGQWKLAVNGPAGSSYLLIASIASSLSVKLDGLPFPSASPGQTVQAQSSVSDSQGAGAITNVSYQVGTISHGAAAIGSAQNGSARLPTTSALVSLQITVTGTTSSGSSFERTFFRTIPVLSDPSQLKGLGSSGP